eukprot:jgi/Psemu1/15446/gm1.15446_g
MITHTPRSCDLMRSATKPSTIPTSALYDASLNKAYSEIIGKDELSEFFVTREGSKDEGPLEIAPDPQLHIQNCIAKAIAINLIDPDEVTKGHIANLLSKCVVKHVRNNGSTKRMRYKTDFDAAAKHAIRTNTDEEPTVLFELTITYWRFKKEWRPDLFMQAYTRDPPSAVASRARFAKLLQQTYTKPKATPKAVPLHRKPIQPNDPDVNKADPVLSYYVSVSPNVLSSYVPSSSGTTDLITNKAIDSDDTATPSNSSARAHHPSPRSGHPSASSRAPTNARWSFHPQPDTVAFFCPPQNNFYDPSIYNQAISTISYTIHLLSSVLRLVRQTNNQSDLISFCFFCFCGVLAHCKCTLPCSALTF